MESKERELVLAPFTFAHIQNRQKGEVNVFVGPHKSNLDASGDQPVRLDYRTKSFEPCRLEQAITNNIVAPEGFYVQLKNPEKNGKHPSQGTSSSSELHIGKKVNIAGPVEFALYPGQMTRVIQGHHLKTNQYLLVRVYDEESAKLNWDKAIIKKITDKSEDQNEKLNPEKSNPENEKSEDTLPETSETQQSVLDVTADEVTMGKLMIIKGTDVSFYIPPTGIEIVKIDDEYVQDAVTLERLYYCVLLDENGNKEYVYGPAVVFPKPTQKFIVDKNKIRKYKAITLNDISGLYIQVTKKYEENGKTFKVGDELFITGKDCPIYYPREEHAIIKYGTEQKHYSVAIPKGEGRYLLNRITGETSLVKGPDMLLPDPRSEVLTRRVLSDEQCKTWYPGDNDVLLFNQQLRKEFSAIEDDDSGDENSLQAMSYMDTEPTREMSRSVLFSKSMDVGNSERRYSQVLGGGSDTITRSTTFTKPRSICLEGSKFDGAIRIPIKKGYAVNIQSTSGESRTIIGPQSVLLEYDEVLVGMKLSRHIPKTSQDKIHTPYLRYLNNRIADRIEIVTKDLCTVTVGLSYMVDFNIEQKDKWFDVENYVQFLCDRMRSIIRREAKLHTIEELHNKHVDIIRNLVINRQQSDSPVKSGRCFNENGMVITDVDIEPLVIEDHEISQLLAQANFDVIHKNLKISRLERELSLVKEEEQNTLLIECARNETKIKTLELSIKEEEKGAELKLAQQKAESDKLKAERDAQKTLMGIVSEIKAIERQIVEDDSNHDMNVLTQKADLFAKQLNDESEAFAARFKAISPQLITSLENLGNKNMTAALTKNLSLQAMLKDKSVSDILGKALDGTALGRKLDLLFNDIKSNE